jgi:flagellar basal body-associated protein FliL
MRLSRCLSLLAVLALSLSINHGVASAAGGGSDKGASNQLEELSLDYGAFIALDPLTLPIVDDLGITQMVSMTIVVEAKSERYRDIVRNVTPRLKDAYIQELYGVLHQDQAMNNGIVNAKMLKKEILRITIKVLGADVVNDVLLQGVNQRTM